MSMGEVMVYLRGLWGAVCADNFTGAAADSVCRQLGYTNSNGQSKRGYVVMKSELLVTVKWCIDAPGSHLYTVKANART